MRQLLLASVVAVVLAGCAASQTAGNTTWKCTDIGSDGKVTGVRQVQVGEADDSVGPFAAICTDGKTLEWTLPVKNVYGMRGHYNITVNYISEGRDEIKIDISCCVEANSTKTFGEKKVITGAVSAKPHLRENGTTDCNILCGSFTSVRGAYEPACKYDVVVKGDSRQAIEKDIIVERMTLKDMMSESTDSKTVKYSFSITNDSKKDKVVTGTIEIVADKKVVKTIPVNLKMKAGETLPLSDTIKLDQPFKAAEVNVNIGKK